MLRSLIASWPLFFGLFLIMIGNGLLVFMLGVRANNAGFSTFISSIMMGGYFFGFFGGSQIVPKLLSSVGHIRTFGALSAIASAAVLMHLVKTDPYLWTAMRVFTGFAYAGMYIVVESWLNAKATNETRGQMLSIYMIITMGGLGLGQISGGFDNGITSQLFLLASILVSIAVVPILLTASPAPEFAEPESVSMRRLYSISPLAMLGMVLQGMTASMTFGLGAIYATMIGLTSFQAALFASSVTIGNMLLQYPVGRLSDIFDRRKVIMLVAGMAGISAFSASFLGPSHFWVLVILTALYGGFSLTIYSLCIAHANDYLTPSQMVGTASTLITVNGIGAIVGAPLVGGLIDIAGAQIYFIVVALIHGLLVGLVLVRMSIRPSVPIQAQGPFIAVPEIGTAVVASLNPEAAWSEEENDVDNQASLFEDNPYLQITPTSSAQQD